MLHRLPALMVLLLGELALLLFAYAVVAAYWAGHRLVRTLRRTRCHQRLRQPG